MQNPSFLELIKTRRSIRAYTDKPVPREILDEIIECARYSPTALGKASWHFTVATDRLLIKEAGEAVRKTVKIMLRLRFILRFIYPVLSDEKFLNIAKEKVSSSEDRIFYDAPVVVFISTPKKNPHGLKDSMVAAENIMLASHALGLGSCMIGFADAIKKRRDLLKKLKLPQGHRLQATVVLGYPKSVHHLPQRRRDNLTYI